MIKNDIGPLKILRKHLPDFDSLDLPQLRELSAALEGVVAYLALQEEALRDNQEDLGLGTIETKEKKPS